MPKQSKVCSSLSRAMLDSFFQCLDLGEVRRYRVIFVEVEGVILSSQPHKLGFSFRGADVSQLVHH